MKSGMLRRPEEFAGRVSGMDRFNDFVHGVVVLN
jgi:hypothetical protein